MHDVRRAVHDLDELAACRRLVAALADRGVCDKRASLGLFLEAAFPVLAERVLAVGTIERALSVVEAADRELAGLLAPGTL